MTRAFTDEQQLEETIDKLTKTIREASEKYIPNKTYENENPRQIQEAIKYRNYLRRGLQRTRNQQLKRQLDEQINVVRSLITSHNQEIWNRKIENATKNTTKSLKRN